MKSLHVCFLLQNFLRQTGFELKKRLTINITNIILKSTINVIFDLEAALMNIIYEIRKTLQYSQMQFADKLNVAFATVNRWENEKAVPNRLAQEKILSICQKENINLVEIIEKKIKEEAQEIEKKNPKKKILFHGSKSGIKGKIRPSSRDRCDFGAGFYMGTEPLQPLTLICDYEKSVFYIVSVPEEDLGKIEVLADIDWAMLIAYHRGRMEEIAGTELYKKYAEMDKGYDIIIGKIANDRMFYVLDSFFQGNVTDIALIKSLSALQLGSQYVAVTQKACDTICIEKEVPLLWMERQILKEASEKNRQKGIEFANQICKDYRREGRYFDEIIDDAKLG